MIKRLRENRKNKKGFTLVELIVVIVIILVLAAVLVPSVLRYIEKANQANCKADAATTLTQLQVNVADYYSENENDEAFKPGPIGAAQYKGEVVDTTIPADKEYYVTIAAKDDTDNHVYIGDVTKFSFGNAKYYINWTKDGGWGEVITRKKA